MSLETSTQLVVDRSPPDELLKINFNIRCASHASTLTTWYPHLRRLIPLAFLTTPRVTACPSSHSQMTISTPASPLRSYPSLSCEFVTLDVSDALGTVS